MSVPTRPRPGNSAPASPETRPRGTRTLLQGILAASVGVLVMTGGYVAGWRGDSDDAGVLWYSGMVLLSGSFGWLILQPFRRDTHRLALGLAYALLLYCSWLFANPVMASRFDETLHVSTLVGLIREGFFQGHDMLVVSPFYPGLELATVSVHWLTGLPLIACQIIAVIVSRSTLVVAMFALVRRVTGSGRAAGLAVILYGASTHFWFYNAQFGYQTAAIGIFVAALCLLTRTFDAPEHWPWRRLAAVAAAIAALTVTHHLTSWLLCGTLVALTVSFGLARERRRARLTAVVAGMSLMLILAWAAIVGPRLIDYLAPIFRTAGGELLSILEGEAEGRSIGQGRSGQSAPWWDLALMGGSVLIWLALLVPACWWAWRRGSIGTSRARYLVIAIAASYPLLHAMRLSDDAGEIGDRVSTFVFMAMVLVIAAWLTPRLYRFRHLAIPALVVLVVGGAVLGNGPDWRRTSGPYLPAADHRSVDAYSLAVAEWVQRYVPEGSRIGTDNTMNSLLPTIANVRVVTRPGGLAGMTDIFISADVDEYEIDQLTSSGTDFLVVDWRLADVQPTMLSLYEGSSGYGEIAARISSTQLAKFHGQPGFDLVLDGPVRVYDLRSLRGEPQTFTDREPAGLPGTQHPWQMGWAGILLLLLAAATWRRRILTDCLSPTPALLVLPAMIAVGAAGVLLGGSVWLGSGLLTLLLGAAGARLRSLPRRTQPTERGHVLLALAIITVLAFSAVVASWAAADTLLPDFQLPPPVGAR